MLHVYCCFFFHFFGFGFHAFYFAMVGTTESVINAVVYGCNGKYYYITVLPVDASSAEGNPVYRVPMGACFSLSSKLICGWFSSV